MQEFTREMANIGHEKTPREWRQYLDYVCDLHCCEFPAHHELSLEELWSRVVARINDENDPFTGDLEDGDP